MKIKIKSKVLQLLTFVALVALMGAPSDLAAPAPEPNISVVAYFSNDKVQRGRTVRVGVVIDIPSGYHINSNRPLENYLIATQLKVDVPSGVKVGPVSYPRALMKTFKFSKNKLSVYERQTILRFEVTVPANYSGGTVDLKTHVRLQSCNDEVCFPPKTHNQDLRISVVGATDRVQRTNGWVFSGR